MAIWNRLFSKSNKIQVQVMDGNGIPLLWTGVGAVGITGDVGITGAVGVTGFTGLHGWTGSGMDPLEEACMELQRAIRKSSELRQIFEDHGIEEKNIVFSDFLDTLLTLPAEMYPPFLGIHNVIDKAIAERISSISV